MGQTDSSWGKKSIKNLKTYNNKWEDLFINIFNASTKEQAPKSQPFYLYVLSQLCIFFPTFHISSLFTHGFFSSFVFSFWYNFECNERLLVHVPKNFWILFTRLLFNCLHFYLICFITYYLLFYFSGGTLEGKEKAHHDDS